MSKKTGMNGDMFKKRWLAPVKQWVYAHQKPKILQKCLCSISSFVLLNCDFYFLEQSTTFLLRKKDKNLTKSNQSIVDIGIDIFYMDQTEWHVSCTYLLSEKTKIKFLFKEVQNYIHKKCMSYKVNLIHIRILITHKIRIAI